MAGCGLNFDGAMSVNWAEMSLTSDMSPQICSINKAFATILFNVTEELDLSN